MSKEKIIAIIQARMGAHRLPGKVLMSLSGKPVLLHVVERLRHCKLLDQIVVATTEQKEDDAVIACCKAHNISSYRGSMNDLLDRYYRAAQTYKADVVVRITADCPVIDPVIVDEVINGYCSGDYDLYSLDGEFPDGLDCQVFRLSGLERAWREATLPSEREHVGPYFFDNNFKLGSYKKFSGLAEYRWTLDEEQDFQLLARIYDELYQEDKLFLTQDILALLESNPDISKINRSIIRNEGYLKSLKEDNEYLQRNT